jgi:hypothetical protein
MFIPENCGKMMADVCVHMVFFIHNVETKEWIRVESMVTKVERVSRHDVFVVPSTTKPFYA